METSLWKELLLFVSTTLIYGIINNSVAKVPGLVFNYNVLAKITRVTCRKKVVKIIINCIYERLVLIKNVALPYDF